MKKKVTQVVISGALGTALLLGGVAAPVGAVGEGPNYNGNETIKNERLHTYEEMVKFLKKIESRSNVAELEVYGQSVKSRDLYLVKFMSDPANPTILFLTQQHGNETLTTEGALKLIQHLSSNNKEVKEILSKVNVLIAPRLNVDGAEGDVNFSLDDYVSGTHTRYNANEADLNRDHLDLAQPETKAFHENILQKYNIDYLIDFHHQGALNTLGDSDQLVSGSILYPTNPQVDPAVVEKSKKLGAVLYNTVEARGFGTLSKYVGGTANNIGRNGIASQYNIATLLFEMRGMADHYRDDYVLGQKSNGYLIKQAVISMEAALKAIADGSIEEIDTSFWDSLPKSGKKGEE
ncbi:carboxypeptidase [Bacillus aquiflavi]|uniref:Carboxypeptidase n=1 Tax=Bacillus aquiflavi TaxID=2672567 RepID=A0A6B3W551_9BACI|nr:M14 family zinc carboxypeptidase [Bacillus aquiflavi]MBA4538734.1 carboxypeptidase [Bacillus aquiflavi]NEY83093.1 carboxypeptidase [Bacillus aquiflavi]UAC48387.1 carboxypeptidase [Bacillus aquiflavi]